MMFGYNTNKQGDTEDTNATQNEADEASASAHFIWALSCFKYN